MALAHQKPNYVKYVAPQDIHETADVIESSEFLTAFGGPTCITTKFDDELWLLSRKAIQTLFLANNQKIQQQEKRIEELEGAIKSMRTIGREAL